MDKFFATFSLTYKNKVKTKSFVIFTAIVILLMVGAANIKKLLIYLTMALIKLGLSHRMMKFIKSLNHKVISLMKGQTLSNYQKNKQSHRLKTKN